MVKSSIKYQLLLKILKFLKYKILWYKFIKMLNQCEINIKKIIEIFVHYAEKYVVKK